MRRLRLSTLLVVALVVLAGCAAPFADSPPVAADGNAADGGDGSTGDTATGDGSFDFADPTSDRLGWEAGYWYNESIDVDQSDGLSDAELDAFVGRSMARVEVIRGIEFRSEVPVEVIARSEYRNGSSDVPTPAEDDFAAWNNQVWEALFIVGEDANVQQELSNTQGSSVVGFYAPGDDEIKIITENPESPVLRNTTLIHELVHAAQDQRFDLTEERYRGGTQDHDLAVDGLIEGDANFVEDQYVRRCASGEWECVPTPSQQSGSSGPPPNLGILLTVFQPYSDGPVYVSTLKNQGGWEAVNDEFDAPPTTTEQVIHVTDEEPVPIEFRDRSRNGWALYPDQGEDGSDTVGEASIFAMFWTQARDSSADTLDPRGLFETDSDYDTYNYAADPSAGWGNDRVFPYHKGSGQSAEYGYVWVTEWDTDRDASEFLQAYRAILRAQGATEEADDVWVVSEGPYADAFRVTRSGTRVVIVNAPTVEDLDDVRPR
ncbi:Hvo_1808 family surface protein [Salinigranum salinum]|uniref:Hvo_1808 family surface protein n=1 Tax=Salinigranum salinum TaxID=1364937 RepID=UPI00126133D3|nr:Hvo_1808 family surface protein [Salinigranum salinum]